MDVDADSPSIYGLAIDPQDMACGLCGKTLPQDGEFNTSLQPITMCGDCKFLLLEDPVTPTQVSRRRRLRRRSTTYQSSESNTSPLTHHFSQIIILATHIDNEPEDNLSYDPNVRMLVQAASSHITPSGSTRWRQTVFDTESDGFNSDSFCGETESNFSFSASHRVYHGDSDFISFSTDGGDSDATVEGHNFFERDIFVQSMERSDMDSDSDIDPMHVGAVQWNSDDNQVEDNEWEEIDVEELAIGSPESGAHIHTSVHTDSIIRHGRHNDVPSFFTNLEEFGDSTDFGDAEDTFREFLAQLEDDSSRRGTPPAALSFVNSLPLVVISDEHEKSDGLACAICRDILAIGTEANQLPCLHLYHPSCILPWLSARNSCPLCRYELPTDDIEYEQGKRNARNGIIVSENQQHDGSDDNSSVISGASSVNEIPEVGELSGDMGSVDTSLPRGGRGRWLFLAATPIVSLVGVVVVLWLGNSLTRARCQIGQRGSHSQHTPLIHTSGSGSHNQRARRWWWF